MIASDCTKVGHALFGLIPDEEMVTAHQKCAASAEGRYGANVLPDGSVGMCPSVHLPVRRVTLLLNLLDCPSLQNGPEKTSLL